MATLKDHPVCVQRVEKKPNQEHPKQQLRSQPRQLHKHLHLLKPHRRMTLCVLLSDIIKFTQILDNSWTLDTLWFFVRVSVVLFNIITRVVMILVNKSMFSNS